MILQLCSIHRKLPWKISLTRSERPWTSRTFWSTWCSSCRCSARLLTILWRLVSPRCWKGLATPGPTTRPSRRCLHTTLVGYASYLLDFMFCYCVGRSRPNLRLFLWPCWVHLVKEPSKFAFLVLCFGGSLGIKQITTKLHLFLKAMVGILVEWRWETSSPSGSLCELSIRGLVGIGGMENGKNSV